MTYPERLLNTLLCLGSSLKEVSEKLTAEGCFGDRNSPCDCPTAVYLRKNGFSSPYIYGRAIFAGNKGACVPTPKSIMDFIREFDAGEIPCLDLAKPCWESLWESLWYTTI